MPDIHRRDVLRLAVSLPVAGGVLLGSPAGAVGYAMAGAGAASAPIVADLCVYGATVAGVAAAVQMRRMGGTAVILEPTAHIGGMSTGGLSRSDIGTGGSVGGLAREFYRRIHAVYGGASPATPALVTEPMLTTFEPHVADSVLSAMLSGAGVTVYTHRTLAAVSRTGSAITAVTADDGTVVQARMFVDASYEGDLLALAGVRFTVGRESASVYGESHNGVQLSAKNQFGVSIDPYRTKGNPASGLAPGVSGAALAAAGTGDTHVQAYCYRLCLTRAANRIPFAKPAAYDPNRYLLALRLIAAGYADTFPDKADAFLNKAALPNGKADANSGGPFSFDNIGAADAYPTATWTQRAAIVADHLTYQQGLLYFLGNDTRVRADVRAAIGALGLAPDEFAGTGHWSPQLYVREARRMISSYVVTEADCTGLTTPPDGVAMASYRRDTHNAQRLVVAGAVTNEGDVQLGVPAPYPVSYRAIVPDAAQCTNLLVPVCLSASHIAYGSLRMEPVFMTLGQAAGTAAKLALDAGVGVQSVDITALRTRLFEDMAILRYPDVAVDDTDPATVVTGGWTVGASASGYYGTGYLQDGNTGKGGKSVRFVPNLPSAGNYLVYLRWTSATGRAANVPVTVSYQGGSTTVAVDQRSGGGRWSLLGTWPFAAGPAGGVTVATTGTTGYVIADAVRFVAAP